MMELDFDTQSIPNGKNVANFGIGLKNIKYRVQDLLNGTIEIVSKPNGKGTTISIEIPITPKNHTNE